MSNAQFRIEKQLRRGIAGLIFAAWLGMTGCDFLDPTNVDNPSTTEDDLAAAEEPTKALIPGLRAQLARALDPTIPEVVSDNYSIHGTGIDKTNDSPSQISPQLSRSFGGMYADLQELRALSEFVLNEIAPNDATATPEQLQEARYHLGMAFLLLGERFIAAPVQVDGTPVDSDALVQLAITEFETALTLLPAGAFADPARGVLARAYRQVGNATQAESFANAVLGVDLAFLFEQDYDPSTVTNTPFAFLFLRSLKEMQPLPRLDFLDPKFTAREAPIAISKSEEMYLILAEVLFSRGDFAGGREQIALAIEAAQARPAVAFDDDDQRLNEDLTERPHDASILIQADGSSPFRAGLVLTRPGTVNTPTVAATSLVADSIRMIPDTDQESLLHALHLARQEMLLLEGRRMTDLGIRLPMTGEEINTNPNIDFGDIGTGNAFVPSYVPPNDEMDLFSPASPYDAMGVLVTTQITGMFDMNRLLAQNRVSPFGIP